MSLRFDAPVVTASFHPKNSKIILVLLATGEAYVCDQRKARHSRVELLELLETSLDEGEDEDGPIRYAVVFRNYTRRLLKNTDPR